ncbi:MAG TPA: PilZ domain-containing protein [Nitrospirota bacterium]
MKTSSSAQQKKTTSRFIMRPYRRIPTWYLSYYMSGDLVGKGVVTNLSRTGMRVLGDHAMRPGMDLTVRLTVEEDKPPLEIERVIVQWVKEAEFGLRIVRISPSAATRITHLLAFQARAHRGES